jgi:cell filamentation protein
VTDTYHYPGTQVLRNRFGYRDPQILAEVEGAIAAARMAELAANPIDGHFDFAHLQAIHRHLLGDLYEWAGDIRTIDTAPGDLGILHDPPAAIPGELDRVFTDINSGVYVNHHSHEAFVQDLAGHWGDLTSVHPFVDGNSRTQRVFFDQLARDVGWVIEWRELSVDAVQAARNFAYVDGGTILADVLRPAIKPVTEVPADSIATAPRGSAMTFPEHWQAMIEHYDTMPEQTYTWASQIKSEAPQDYPQSIEIRPTRKPAVPGRELADLDTTKFHTHWSPEVDHQLMNSRTIPQDGSREEGPRL